MSFLRAIRILIARDDPDLRTSMATVLAEEGFEVIHAACSTAVAAFQQCRPDVVILDAVDSEGDASAAAGAA